MSRLFPSLTFHVHVHRIPRFDPRPLIPQSLDSASVHRLSLRPSTDPFSVPTHCYHGLLARPQSYFSPLPFHPDDYEPVLTTPTPSGGFFAGKITSTTETGAAGGRFDPNSPSGKMYRERYVNEGYVNALAFLKGVAVSGSFVDRRITTACGEVSKASEQGVLRDTNPTLRRRTTCLSSRSRSAGCSTTASLRQRMVLCTSTGLSPSFLVRFRLYDDLLSRCPHLSVSQSAATTLLRLATGRVHP